MIWAVLSTMVAAVVGLEFSPRHSRRELVCTVVIVTALMALPVGLVWGLL